MKTRLLKILLLSAVLLPSLARAETGPVLEHPPGRFDRQSIGRGARVFAQYCFSCHSLKYMRYNLLVNQLGLPKAVVQRDIMLPDGAKLNQNMVVTLAPAEARHWFGKVPPDLTLEARYRGVDWIYTYLRSFYRDDSRPTGWNNHVFPMVAMPNVLAPLSGERTAHGRVLRAGALSPAQFRQTVSDLVAFLRYTSDPSILQRRALGPKVLAFLAIFTLLAFLMKREYWRDVH